MGIELKVPSYIWKENINFKYKDELTKAIVFDYENYSKESNFTFKFNTEKTNCFMKDFYDMDIPVLCDKNKIFLDELLYLIKNKFDSYLKFYNIQDTFFINRIWYCLYEYEMETLKHDHATADFSGVYYLKFNNKKHNSTFFVNTNFIKEPKKEIIFEPDLNEGDILFFPSGYVHGSKMHMDLDYRILVSFDILCDNFSGLVEDLKSIDKFHKFKYQ